MFCRYVSICGVQRYHLDLWALHFQYPSAQPALVCGMNFFWFELKLSLLDQSMM